MASLSEKIDMLAEQIRFALTELQEMDRELTALKTKAAKQKISERREWNTLPNVPRRFLQ